MSHPLAWLAWTLSAAVAALATRNPFYITILALAAGITFLAVEHEGAPGRPWRGLLRLGALIWLVTIPLNALMVHAGEHVLLRLPARWPLVGGAITVEAIAQGAATGYGLWVLLVIMAAYNLAVDATQLLRYLPAFLHPVGAILSIALAFIPQMLASLQEIREAQRIRGSRLRTWRDQLPLIMPLLTTALERAIQLAESMESRGFGRADAAGADGGGKNSRSQMALLAGLVLLLAGLLVRSLLPQFGILVVPLWILAVMLLAWALRRIGRQAPRSRYIRLRWQPSDIAGTALSLLVLGALLAFRALDSGALAYSPFPPYGLLPRFHPWIGLALAALSLPGLMVAGRARPHLAEAPRR